MARRPYRACSAVWLCAWLVLMRLRRAGQRPAAAAGRGPPAYSLGPGDQVRIITFGEDNLTGEFRVNDSGNIALPLVGAVHAAGLTSGDLEAAVAAALRRGNLVRNPSVAVEVIAYRPIYVLGEVNKPGQYPYQPGMTVVTAVAVAGGFTYRAIEDYAGVVRTSRGQGRRGQGQPAGLRAAGRCHHGVRAPVLKALPAGAVAVSRRWPGRRRPPRHPGAGAAAHHRRPGGRLHRRCGAVAGRRAGFQTIHLSRSSFWGAPSTIARIEALAAQAHAAGLGDLYVEDISRPRGGPLPGGHLSHQLGLDVDVGLDVSPKRTLTAAERETVELPSMVRADQRGDRSGALVTRMW